jgi:hypothetical protein
MALLIPSTPKQTPPQWWNLNHKGLQGVPHLCGFHYRESHYRGFWLMYAQVGDFRVSRGLHTVPLTQISLNVVFFKSQNPRKAGTLCTQRALQNLKLRM